MLKVDGCVCINEAQCDGLFHASIDGAIVFVAIPFESCEHCRRVLAGSEGRIIMQESRFGFEHQHFIIFTDDGVEERVAGLVATFPEVGHTAHVWISRVVDGGDEPLVLGFSCVVNRLHDVFLWVCLSIAVCIVVGFDPIHQIEAHWVANIVVDEDLDFLLHARCFVTIILRSEVHSLRCGRIDLVGALPVAIGRHHMRWVSLIVGLHFVGESIGDIDFRQINAYEECTIVVGGVSCSALDPSIAGDPNIKSAVFWSVFCVLEPHCALEIQRFTCGNPSVVRDIVHGQSPVIVADFEPSKAKAAVDIHCFVAQQIQRRVS